MAAFITESADAGAGFHESLAEKLAKGVMPLLDGLHIAAEIASALRELHQKGLVHGDVRAESVWVDAEGAILEARGTRCGMADARVDMTAFGDLLYEIFAGCKLPVNVPPPAYRPVTVPTSLDEIRQDAMRLGERCHAGKLASTQVLVELKILAIQARLFGAVGGFDAPPAAPACPSATSASPPAAFAPRPPASAFPPAASASRPPVSAAPSATSASPPATSASPPAASARRPPVSAAPSATSASPPATSASPPAASARRPPVSAAPPELEPAAAESHGMLICPKCSGPAPKFLVPPHSMLQGILNRMGPLRECELCGYRFIVIRIRRASH